MTDDIEGPAEWSDEELHRVDELYEETAPPADMEDAVVSRLAAAGTLRVQSDADDSRRVTRTVRSGRQAWLQLAAGLVLFLSGYLLGRPEAASAPVDSPFYLLLHELEDEAALGTPEETRRVDAYRSWMGSAAARGPVDGLRLSARSELLEPAFGGQPLSPGVVGFFEIAVTTWEEALEVARTHPHLQEGGWIEVRRATPTEPSD